MSCPVPIVTRTGQQFSTGRCDRLTRQKRTSGTTKTWAVGWGGDVIRRTVSPTNKLEVRFFGTLLFREVTDTVVPEERKYIMT